VAKGDLTQPMTLERDGRPLEGEFLAQREDRQQDDSNSWEFSL
jgi:hypothetical protein